ncbi:MAG: efflux RND transporter periplasmic adaptor subunit [Thermoanaerobacterales bacterium]|nr:efflux RND transporter periplasmic adaptor subunit [Thermoanaerobacterales bacterium]
MDRPKRLVLAAVLGLLVLGLVLAGCGQKGQNEAAKDQAVPVAVAEVTKGRLDRGDILTGKVAAAVEVNLVPKMAGKVGQVLVDVGDRVKAGQVVLRLDAPEMAAAVTLAESGLRQAEINFDSAKKNYERGKLLLEQQAIAPAEFENAYQKPYDLAKEAYDRTAPAQLAQARANYENTILTTPVTGVVTARNVNPGELASPSMPVLTIVNIDAVFVETTASEEQINRLKPGQEVTVRIKAAGDQSFKGTIATVSPAADPQTRAYPVKVRIANPDGVLKPGMFATIDLGGGGETLMVPRDAVVFRGEKSTVFVVEGNQAKVREVTVGESDGRNIAVISGLEAGEKVVVSGQSVLNDGAKILVADQEAKR